MSAQLHVHSWFSFLQGASSPQRLAEAAVAKGVTALAITDPHGLYSAVKLQKACDDIGIKSIFGAEIWVDDAPLVLLAKTREGYANLSRLLTHAHQTQLPDKEPQVNLQDLAKHSEDLFCLTGGREGLLWRHIEQRKSYRGITWLEKLKNIYDDHLYIELTHHHRPGDNRMARRMVELGSQCDIPIMATGDVRHATMEDYATYDVMCCIRDKNNIFEPTPKRPYNDQACLKSRDELSRLIPYPDAFDNAEYIAEQCNVDLIPELITPPAARIPEGHTANSYLIELCTAAMDRRYTDETIGEARRQFNKELEVIGNLELEEFFIVVQEVVDEANRRDIRCAGRGSAANSIIAYLLGITAVDPVRHKLLFERFLHGGRKGTPDIDVDFDTFRRDEIIAWMEQRFGIEQTCMTGTIVSYQLRSAMRDVAKAFGFPLVIVDKVCANVPRRSAGRVRDYEVAIRNVLGNSPLVEKLISMIENFHACPRHLGLHSGGMILSRTPLPYFTPVQVSANGVKVAQFAKYDVEALGLVKLDVLGLRMMASISYCASLIKLHQNPDLDIDNISLDDPAVYQLMKAGETIGLFQIESQGQLHLLSIHQPENFEDLMNEIALFRPGPVQGGMVRPFVRRRRGKEKVVFQHPDLVPILEETYGIILFQEQVLEVAHQFAGMSLEEADDFRNLMSKFRDPGEMENMRGRFVDGAVGRGIDPKTADAVFEKLSKFVGFGFCKSHAAAFAKTVYQSAWLKHYYPEAYMASIFQHRPGMYPLMTLEEEARHMGIDILLPDVNDSGVMYDLVKDPEGKYAIQQPLTAIASITSEDAQEVIWARLEKPFEDIEDFYKRVNIARDSFDNIARSGALDRFAKDGRDALWHVGVVANRVVKEVHNNAQTNLFVQKTISPEDIPNLPDLEDSERLSWDYDTISAARKHPMTLVRRQLNELEVRTIETCYQFGNTIEPEPYSGRDPIITVAGISILRQKPGTAKGFMFLTLEDETGFIQCVVPPQAQDYLDHVLTSSALIVRGALQMQNSWRGIVLEYAWRLDGIFGGYVGRAAADGGRDRWVKTQEVAKSAISKSKYG